MHSVYISPECLSFLEFSSRATSLGGGKPGFLGMDDVFFRTFVHNSCNEICFLVMSECFDYFGVVGCSFRTTVAGGWCRSLGSFIAMSYVHHMDCAYINSPEKVDDPCS
jgi:hypothetical protein